MIGSIAVIHIFLVLQSQMARLSNRHRRHPRGPDMHPLLEPSSHALPGPQIVKLTSPPRCRGSPNRSQSPISRPKSRITLRLTGPRRQRPHRADRRWIAPAPLVDPSGHSDPEDAIVIEKDREDWLRRLRPRPHREPAPVRAKFSKSKRQ